MTRCYWFNPPNQYSYLPESVWDALREPEEPERMPEPPFQSGQKVFYMNSRCIVVRAADAPWHLAKVWLVQETGGLICADVSKVRIIRMSDAPLPFRAIANLFSDESLQAMMKLLNTLERQENQ